MQSYYSSQAQGGAGISDYRSYYKSQSGDGVGQVYTGYQFQGQRGGGWFGRIIKGGIMPVLSKILPYLGSKAVDAYKEMVQDFQSGKDLKEIGKRQLKRSAASVARDVAEKLSKQTGSGIRRKRKRSVSINTFRRKKRTVSPVTTPKRRKTSKLSRKKKQKTIRRKRKSSTKTSIGKLFS